MNGTNGYIGPHFLDGGAALDAQASNTAITTVMGHAFDISDQSTWAKTVNLTDTAWALSNICRYGGHVEFYSVAEHAVRVSIWLAEQGYSSVVQFIGLHHDDPEAWLLGDVPKPQKDATSIYEHPYSEVEDELSAVVYAHYGIAQAVVQQHWAAVKEADHAIYLEERRERPTPGMSDVGMVPHAARHIYLAHHKYLGIMMEKE